MTLLPVYADALSTMRETLRSDGYDLDLLQDGDAFVVSVTAGPDACAECLVPKPIFEALVRGRLAEVDARIDDVRLIVQYPDEHPPEASAPR